MRCEGVDARVAQNAREDSGVAMAAGMVKLAGQLLEASGDSGGKTVAMQKEGQQLRSPVAGLSASGSDAGNNLRGSDGAEPASRASGEATAAAGSSAVRPIVVVISDDIRLARQLRQLRLLGFAVILVTSSARWATRLTRFGWLLKND